MHRRQSIEQEHLAARSCIRIVAGSTASLTAQACDRHDLKRSMGDTGICWDNAGAKSFWSSFKHEYYYRHTFATRAELVAALDNWIRWLNNERRHSAVGMLSPIRYEQSLTGTAKAA